MAVGGGGEGTGKQAGQAREAGVRKEIPASETTCEDLFFFLAAEDLQSARRVSDG